MSRKRLKIPKFSSNSQSKPAIHTSTRLFTTDDQYVNQKTNHQKRAHLLTPTPPDESADAGDADLLADSVMNGENDPSSATSTTKRPTKTIGVRPSDNLPLSCLYCLTVPYAPLASPLPVVSGANCSTRSHTDSSAPQLHTLSSA
jgi:hypothetical protein